MRIPSHIHVAVVIPAYRVEEHIEEVIRTVPGWVRTIIVVEDASPDDTARIVESIHDPRLRLIRHEQNQGVGGAMRTGFREAMTTGADIVVKMDGDGQMDPLFLPALIEPLVHGTADMTKGNRYRDFSALKQMPVHRIIGNAGLTFLVKLASGYWHMFDPTNGYFSIRTSALRHLNLEKLPSRYYFESGLLVRLGIAGACLRDVSMPARYGTEKSSLSVLKTLLEFPPRLAMGLISRLFWRYMVFDFSAVSVFLLGGIPLLLGGSLFGLNAYSQMKETGVPTSAGTVMLAAMPIIIGTQMVLQAIVVDIGNVPKTPISPHLDAVEDDSV